MIDLKPIRMRVLVGLVFFLSTWFFVWSTKSVASKDQVEFFTENSVMSNINKQTGLPKPGTYKLQKIFSVPKLSVLDSKGKLQPISKYTKGKITLLTFFYQRCSDVNGCPYAMGLFHGVKNKLENNENTIDSIRLVNISFDPERDTPMMMAGLEKRSSGVDKSQKSIEWDFLTTASVNDLMPVVDGFGQNVDINMSSITNKKTLSYSHVLKVFLIDSEGYVREIYSTAYLSKDMLLNDIQTLVMEKHN
jgi:cytochrome oxidase Cu insertion factor (SCO1/SenC/PrrC family)